MWQQIAIILTGIATLAYIFYRISQMIRNTKQKNSPCSGCSGCHLRSQIKSKKQCPESTP